MDKLQIEQTETELVVQSLNLLHQRMDSIFEILNKPESLFTLEEIAEDKFSTQVDDLNVTNELLKIKPLGSDMLHSYLLQRVNEADIMLRLRDNDAIDNPPHYVRLIGINGGNANPVVRELNQFTLEHPDHPYIGIDTGDRDNIVLMNVRSSIPISYIENFRNYESAYIETGRNLKEEKYHRAVWRRFIPSPTENVDDAKTKRYILTAYLSDRLELQTRGTNKIVLLKEFNFYAPENPQPVLLGSSADEIKSLLKQRYDLRVEIWSLCWEVWFQQQGPQVMEAALINLDQEIDNPSSSGLISFIASIIDHQTILQMLKDLDWVKDQIVPASMFYYNNR